MLLKYIIVFSLFAVSILPQSRTTVLLLAGEKIIYETEAQRYFDVAGDLTTAQKTRINTVVTMLKDTLSCDSLPERLDWWYFLANNDTVSALKNLIKRDHDAFTIGNPTFTQWQGYLGGQNKYIETTYNNSSDTVTTGRYGASYGYYTRLDKVGGDKPVIGHSSNDYIILYPFFSDNKAYVRINSNNYESVTVTNSYGCYIGVRDGGSVLLYKNGTGIINEADPTKEVPAGNMRLLGTVSRFSDNEIAVAFGGSKFTDVEARGVTNIIEWYMDDLGKGVIP